METKIIRPHAEHLYASELAALIRFDGDPRPLGWKLSPRSVVAYILGGQLEDGTQVTPKYIGKRRLIEIAVATLATDRALLLLGVPGTAKTWLSEHLAAAISGDSTLIVQGTAGLGEEALRYTWNYARLIAEGPGESALVSGPVMTGMKQGKIVRVEELTRMPSEVQDALISILSEKVLPIPELGTEVSAVQGFNIIATANDRDRGINDLSSALRRRFNTVIMPLPEKLEEEVNIVLAGVGTPSIPLKIRGEMETLNEIKRLVTVFRELRNGKTEDGRIQLKIPTGTLSAAEAISAVNNGLTMANFFGKGKFSVEYVASGMTGAIIQDRVSDLPVWQEYLETVMRDREGWGDLYAACKKEL
jgi:MoxR-like ATPase